MDFSTAIVGIIILSVFIIPVILMTRKNKNKTKLLLNSLQRMANQYQSEIDQYETFNTFAIGIDSLHKQAYFYKDNKRKNENYHVDLTEIKECKPEVITHKIKEGKKTSQVIDSVALQLIPTSSNKRILLEFYNADEGLQLNGELKAIEKWSKLINQQLVVK